ncbi:MAG: hypothetical protein GW949_11200, partial [Spirochaetales bacterium]|nr:hypothetical protein [Spirochaetales bacterium]
DLLGLRDFYISKLGFRVFDSGPDFVVVGSSEPLLFLRQATDEPRRQGLYHLAFLFSEYKDFGAFILNLAAQKIGQSPTDHTQTIATYFSDPEGNGLEFYLDTPERGQMFTDQPGFVARRADGVLVPATRALDLDEVFAAGQIDPNTFDPGYGSSGPRSRSWSGGDTVQSWDQKFGAYPRADRSFGNLGRD